MSTTANHLSTYSFDAWSRPRAAALRAEWTKLRTLRATWITMGFSLAASLALGALAAGSDVRNWDDMSAAERAVFDPTSTSLVGVLFGALVLGALGVRSMAAEYSTGMIRTTAAAIPDRTRMLFAKVAVVATSTFAVAAVANLIGFSVGQALFREEGIAVSLSDRDSVEAIIGGAIAVSAFAVLGLGLGTLARRASIANILLALVVIGGQLVGSVMSPSTQRYLPFNALKATVSVVPADDVLAPGVALAVLVAYPVIVILAAWYALLRRDV
jgi:ABC-2 type transport system permease protein